MFDYIIVGAGSATNAVATRILIERDRVCGVAFLQAGTRRQERALREVIVSSGAIKSPQLLIAERAADLIRGESRV
jgi:choline dehydrogenase-like flavoprotein